MTDYISRKLAHDSVQKCADAIGDVLDILVTVAQRLPDVDVTVVTHARWLKNDNETWSCSRCNSWIPHGQYDYARFCLYCGARMDDAIEEVSQ